MNGAHAQDQINGLTKVVDLLTESVKDVVKGEETEAMKKLNKASKMLKDISPVRLPTRKNRIT